MNGHNDCHLTEQMTTATAVALFMIDISNASPKLPITQSLAVPKQILLMMLTFMATMTF